MSGANIKKTVKEIQQLSKTIPMLADAMKGLKEHGLTERALIVLAADASGVPRRQTERVIKSFKKLKSLYTRKIKDEYEPSTSDSRPEATG